MDLHELNKYRDEKERHMRHGHLSKEERDNIVRNEFAKNYHDQENNYTLKIKHAKNKDFMHGIDENSHGAELQ